MLQGCRDRPPLPSFPTRRSSDLADLLSCDELVDFRVNLLPREQAGLDHALELALEHVEFPGNDHNLIHLRPAGRIERSEEHTSELQSHVNLVCRLLLEKKNQRHL